MGETKSDILQGTLDLMVLQTLDAMGPLHGYGIARRIEQVAQGSLALNQGTIYPALLRLEQKGWIKSEWGASETTRAVFSTDYLAKESDLAEVQPALESYEFPGHGSLWWLRTDAMI